MERVSALQLHARVRQIKVKLKEKIRNERR